MHWNITPITKQDVIRLFTFTTVTDLAQHIVLLVVHRTTIMDPVVVTVAPSRRHFQLHFVKFRISIYHPCHNGSFDALRRHQLFVRTYHRLLLLLYV